MVTAFEGRSGRRLDVALLMDEATQAFAHHAFRPDEATATGSRRTGCKAPFNARLQRC